MITSTLVIFKFMQTKQGFTLIELLVVIAIIGVLASIIITGLSSSRVSARIKSTQQSMVSAKNALLVCIQGGGEMTLPIVVGESICTPSVDDSQVWPTLAENSDWAYLVDENLSEVVALADSHEIAMLNPVSEPDQGTFSFMAYSVVDDRIVSCTETGCLVQ
jgi:prepilin-type N-terminal cleavage/methylation domain-containing protein